MPADLLLITTAFQQDYEVGFANAVARAGLRVSLVGSDNTLTGRLDPAVRFFNPRGSQDPRRPAWRKLLNMIGYFRKLADIVRSHREAVVHHNGIFTMRSGWGVLIEAWVTRRNARTWWVTVHNLLPHDSSRRADRIAFGWAYRHADHLWVHTEATAEQLCRRFDVPRQRIGVIEHGIDRFIEPVPQANAQLSEWYNLPPHRFLALAFGNMSPYKGTDLLVEAAARLHGPADALLLITGKASSAEFRAELEARLAEAAPGGIQVRLIDHFVPDEHLPVLFAAADLMVLPYRRIEQSGVLFAAKAAGCPLLVTDVGSFRHYLQPPMDRIVPPEDPQALAQALKAALQQEPMNAQERHQRVELARERYAWQHTLRAYVDQVRAVTPVRSNSRTLSVSDQECTP